MLGQMCLLNDLKALNHKNGKNLAGNLSVLDTYVLVHFSKTPWEIRKNISQWKPYASSYIGLSAHTELHPCSDFIEVPL